METFLKKITKDCLGIFGDDLVCLLLLGSVQKNDTTPFSDVDLIGVIKGFEAGRLASLREIVRNSEKLLDFSIIFKDEISPDPNKFRMGTHGCYQIELVFKKAHCLYGKNVFLVMPSPDLQMLRKSVFEKLAEYTWWLRRIYVEANRPRSINSNYQINSRLIKMVRDYLFLLEGDDIHGSALTTISRLIEKCPDLLDEAEVAALVNLTHPDHIGNNAGNMSEEYLEIRFRIANKLYEAALFAR